MDVAQIASAIGNTGVLVVIAALFIWFAYYRETKTIPQMMAAFTAGAKESRESFEKQQCAARESCEKQHTELVKSFETQMDREREVCQKWHEENRQGNTQVLNEIKEQRHFIRNLAHAAGLQKALQDAEKEQNGGGASG